MMGIGENIGALGELAKVEGGSGADDLEGDRSYFPDTVDGPQLVEGGVKDPPKTPESLEERLRRLLHVGSGDSERQHQLDCLGLREIVQPRLQEAVTQALAVAVIVRSAVAQRVPRGVVLRIAALVPSSANSGA
jgi:hypothetical protein